MATFSIESNGRLEKTAIYYNGEQLSGLKELFLNLDEDGTYDAIIQYEGTDKKIHTKDIFFDYFDNVKVTPAVFTAEEAKSLRLFTIESDGIIDNTEIFLDEEPLDGVVNIFIHIKPTENKSGLKSLFNKNSIPDLVEFRAEITYRNMDNTLETEEIF